MIVRIGKAAGSSAAERRSIHKTRVYYSRGFRGLGKCLSQRAIMRALTTLSRYSPGLQARAALQANEEGIIDPARARARDHHDVGAPDGARDKSS